MKTGKILLGFALAATILSSCGNSELEARIVALEGRVAALEGGMAIKKAPIKSTSAPTSASTNLPDVKPEGPLPSFKFENEMHDFGNITEGDVVEHVFEFQNTGDAPLIISDAKATCGCTVPKYPREPIPVGGTGEIQVRFNSTKKPGVQNKTVTLTANTYPAQTRIRIKANVAKKES